MKLYFYGQDSGHIDARQLARYFSKEELCGTLEEAELYLVLSGMYLTYGYAEKIEEELHSAAKKGIPVLVVAPHGTPYIPAALRPFASAHCGFSKEEVREATGKLS